MDSDVLLLDLASHFGLEWNSNLLGLDKVAVLIGFVGGQLVADSVLLDLQLLLAQEAIDVLVWSESYDVRLYIVLYIDSARINLVRILLDPWLETVEERSVLYHSSLWVVLFLLQDVIILDKVRIQMVLELFIPYEPHAAVGTLELDWLVQLRHCDDVKSTQILLGHKKLWVLTLWGPVGSCLGC
jgi:hypothetical protein